MLVWEKPNLKSPSPLLSCIWVKIKVFLGWSTELHPWRILFLLKGWYMSIWFIGVRKRLQSKVPSIWHWITTWLLFPGEDYLSHSQYSFVACSPLCRVEDTWAIHMWMEQQLIKKDAVNLKKAKEAYMEGLWGSKRKGENYITTVTISKCA